MTSQFQKTVRLAGCVAALGASLGCGERAPASGEQGKVASGPASGDVLEVVDGIAVREGDLRSLQAAGPLSAAEALARLEAEALLMAEAERRGYGARPAVQRVERQAMVQAYIADQAAAVQVSPDEVAAAYARDAKRYLVGERRACWHALAPLPRDRQPTAEEEETARRVVEEAIAALTKPGADPALVLQGFRGRQLPYKAVRVEQVPPLARDTIVKPFADALFTAAAPGPLPAPVRTVFGWHAVVLTEIVPSQQVPLEQAAPELGAELLQKARTDALAKHQSELRTTHRPEWAPEHRQRLGEPRFDE